MFTSGSTGEPKGAVIPHQGVLSLMQLGSEMVRASPGERFTNINPLHFDNSVFDIYCGLLNGAALVPVETSEIANPATWVRIIRAGKASVMFAVPTLFLILDQLGLLTPQAAARRAHLPVRRRRLSDRQACANSMPASPVSARLINVYGPTETSCICSSIEDHAGNSGRPRQ